MLTACISCAYQDYAHTYIAYILRLFYYINMRIIYTIMHGICMWVFFSYNAFSHNTRAVRYICT